MSRYFSDIIIGDDGMTVVNAIRSSKVIAVSDGSFKEGFGVAAWVIERPDMEGRISCPRSRNHHIEAN
jgi:hypothetical protein